MHDDSFAFWLHALTLILLILDLDLLVNFVDVDSGKGWRREGDLGWFVRLLDHLQSLLAGIVANQVETRA